jgi:hypothetical protein
MSNELLAASRVSPVDCRGRSAVPPWCRKPARTPRACAPWHWLILARGSGVLAVMAGRRAWCAILICYMKEKRLRRDYLPIRWSILRLGCIGRSRLESAVVYNRPTDREGKRERELSNAELIGQKSTDTSKLKWASRVVVITSKCRPLDRKRTFSRRTREKCEHVPRDAKNPRVKDGVRVAAACV